MFFKKMCTLLLVFLMFFGSIGQSISVFANEQRLEFTSEEVQNLLHMEEIASSSYQLSDEENKYYANLTKKEIRTNKLKLNIDKKYLNFKEIDVFRSYSNNGFITAVNVPITGNYSLISAVSLIFDNRDRLISYTETHISEGENHKFKIDIWSNGYLVQEKQTDIEFLSNEQISQSLERLKGITPNEDMMFTSVSKKTGWCIAGILGVDITVALLVGNVCYFACAVQPIGAPVCAGCVTGVCALGVGNISGLIACFKLK